MADLLHWEDFEVGQVFDYGSCTVSEEEIVAFAQEYDPQRFHLDDAYARTTILGGICASGWHTAGIWMRLFSDGYANRAASLGSPGVDEIRWFKPVRPGDVLTGRSEILARRASNSRPDLGLNTMKHQLLNAAGEVVMEMHSTQMLRRRTALATGGERA